MSEKTAFDFRYVDWFEFFLFETLVCLNIIDLGKQTVNPDCSIINTSPLPKHVLSFPAQCLTTTIGRLAGVLAFPRFAIGIEIEQAWGGLSECTYRSMERPNELAKVAHLSLPEFRKQFLSHTFMNCRCKTFHVADISANSSQLVGACGNSLARSSSGW